MQTLATYQERETASISNYTGFLLELERAAAVEKMLTALGAEITEPEISTQESNRLLSQQAQIGAARATYALTTLAANGRIRRVSPGGFILRRRYLRSE